MIQWIKCHVFGRHKYHMEVERLSKIKIDMQLTCNYCNLSYGSKSRFLTASDYAKKNRKLKHLTLIK